MSPDRQSLIAELKTTRKYGALCDDTLAHAVDWALQRYQGRKAILKAAKRKLHQLHGAFSARLDYSHIDGCLGRLTPATSESELKAACRDIMTCHASTAERLEFVEIIYTKLFETIPAPSSILDLACGLNPFALPWMGLTPETRYYAIDINYRLSKGLNTFFNLLERPGAAQCADIRLTPPDQEAELVFLFKTLPLLERQREGSGLVLLKRLNCRRAVVSFPRKTLGGKTVGMDRQYEHYMDQILRELRWEAQSLTFSNEVFYLMECRSAG